MLKKLLFTFCLLAFLITNAQDKIVYDIKVKGVKKTRPSFVKKLIETKSGSALDSITLEKDITVLKRLPGVAHAYYQVFHSHDNLYIYRRTLRLFLS